MGRRVRKIASAAAFDTLRDTSFTFSHVDALLEEFDREWKAGNRARAKEIASEYVGANRDALNDSLQRAIVDYRSQRIYEPPKLEELVTLIDYYRETGDEASRITVDMVLLEGYEPQKISGHLNLGGLTSSIVAEAEAILRGE